MLTLLVFLFGAGCTFGLIKLKERNLNFISVIGAFLLFGYLLLNPMPLDWKVFLANTVSLAILCFVPLVAVLFSQRIPPRPIKVEFLLVFIGGLSTAFFQYTGFAIAWVLGV